ncbi:MAG: LPS export ABC transporter periplasmic protein LptC [Treponema sp.]|nr:LPS export ABC transporter periplasmic protein LptC [Treponema sp.]
MRQKRSSVFVVTGLLVAVLFAAGCSLDYGREENTEASVPEFTFLDVHFVRVEAKKRTMQIDAEKMEQYKSDGSSYARKAEFKTFDKNEAVDTEGSCGLVALDINNERYKLYDGIAINIISQEMKLYAKTLQFNGKTEQLTSGRDDTVTLERKNASVSGKGFSASGVSRSFSFLSAVQGSADVHDAKPADADAESQAESGAEDEENVHD